MLRSRLVILALAGAALVGCGGDSVHNGAFLRVFNGFTPATSTDVRVYAGGHLVSASGVGPAISFGNVLSYDQVPAATETLTVNPYADLNTTYASLTSQSLYAGSYYTMVLYAVAGTTSSTGTTSVTRSAVLLTDGIAPTSGVAYVRIVNATSGGATVYASLTSGSSAGASLGVTAVGLGGSTGYKGLAVTTTDSVSYTLNVYRTSDGSNSLSGSIPITLNTATPVTIVLFTDPSSGAVIARAAGDAVQNTAQVEG